jgi:predicted lysophospholipase L1 biosynthesis ABC-type transport system permease subunit
METIYQPQDDLNAIRKMMERSSKFLSLSGLSGIFAGGFALAGAAVAYLILTNSGSIAMNDQYENLAGKIDQTIKIKLIVDALAVLVLAFGSAVIFSARKARKKKIHIWDQTTRTMLYHLFIPLVAGGVLAIILMLKNHMNMVPAITLLFYGLALVNAGKFTLSEVHYLGLCEIILGLVAAIFLQYGLIFWTIGFGILHILYGIIMYRKYER